MLAGQLAATLGPRLRADASLNLDPSFYMRVQRVMLLLMLAVVTTAPPLSAQDTATAEVRAVIDRLFDGMRAGDSTAVRAAFHPEARLQSAILREGQPVVASTPIDDFVRAVGTPHDAVWDERLSDVEVSVDDPLAQAWMRYEFYLGDRFSHCGVNAMQFVRTNAGWQILQITDTRRPSCD